MQAIPWWAPVLGLVGVALGSLISFFNSEWQRSKQGEASGKKDREAAYVALLTESFTFVNRAQMLGLVKRFRSGLPEGVGVALGQRKPVDALHLSAQFVEHAVPLYEACSRIWLHGTQDAIEAADELMATCAAMLTSMTASASKRPLLLALIIGEGWSAEQQLTYDRALAQVSEKRIAFAKVARDELGREVVSFALERSQEAAANQDQVTSVGRST